MNSDLQNSGAAPSSPLEALVDPRSLVAILWGGRRLIGACVAGCLAVAVGFLLVATKQYQATAKLLVIEQGNSPMSASGGPSHSLVNALEDAIPTHLAILSSPVVIRRAVEAVGLNNLPSTAANPPSVEQTTLALMKGLAVSRPDRLAKIVEVTYRAKSPDEARRVVSAVTESYQRFLGEVYAQGNSAVVVLMTEARDDLKRELKELEERYLEFRRSSPSVLGDASGRTFFSERLEEWNRASRDAMVKAVQLKAQLELGKELADKGIGLSSITYAMDQMTGGPNNGLANRAQAGGGLAPSDYLRQLAAEQQKLSDALGPQSTKVKEIQEQIDQARATAKQARNRLEQDEVGELLDSVAKSLGSLERMRADLQSKLESDLKLAKEAEAQQIAEANLKGELERQRKLFDTVVDQLKQATLVGDFAGTRAVIVEPPTPLSDPVSPKKSLTLTLAMAAGLSLGLAMALGAEVIAPRVRSVADLKRALRLPVLGELPYVAEAQRPPTGSMGLVCETMPRSPMAEAFRVVRANLDLARRGTEARVVLVTAPDAGDGKSTVASNLALALAQTGRKVALVDGDLRSPTQHATFGLTRDRGFTHLIRDLLPLSRVAQATRLATLDLIASGPDASNPAELLSNPDLPQVLDGLRKSYDVVVIDSPPLLAFADASILGAVADAVVLVVRVGSNRRADAVRAVEVLKGLGTPVVGMVVNGGSPDASPVWARAVGTETRPAAEGATTNAPAAWSYEVPLDPQMSLGHVTPAVSFDPRLGPGVGPSPFSGSPTPWPGPAANGNGNGHGGTR